MGTAFLGYVLPWGQISYWGATVITNLLSSVPYVGKELVEVVWGSFSVDNPTLTRFFTLHYLLPFVIAILAVLHLFFLHITGSSNPLGISSNVFKVPFHHYFSVKDLIVYFVALFLFIFRTLHLGYSFMDAANFIPANSLVTPVHIQPEWYFLFAYAILRSIPNKLGGVIALLLAVTILFAFSIGSRNFLFSGLQFSPIMRIIFWSLVSNFILLTWLGACPAADPFTSVALPLSVSYFLLIALLIVTPHITNKLYLS
jgi:ubiquinol-cytochrome c reductase cytochrome b subunit